MMVLALPLFLLRHVSGADTSSMLQGASWLGGRGRGSADSGVSIVRAQASHLFHLFTLKVALMRQSRTTIVSCWHFCDVSARPRCGRYQGESGRSAHIALR
jgi:hypothetical protein